MKTYARLKEFIEELYKTYIELEDIIKICNEENNKKYEKSNK
jgi:hypothetical protein